MREPSPRQLRGARAARALRGALVLLLAACGGLPTREVPESTSPYDRLPSGTEEAFREARARYVTGDFTGARARLATLSDANEDCIVFGVWWQEAEIEVSGPEFVRARSSERARARPSAAAFVLAARAEPERAAAEAWLAEAAKLDPACPWVHHGRAHLAAGAGEWDAARDALARALDADPGHLAARRLQSWMLARDGAANEARAYLRAWLDRADGDPRVLPVRVAGAKLDLALLELGAGEHEYAEELLSEIDSADVEPWRLHCARAAVHQARGEFRAALEQADAARASAPDEVLPAVQRAVLLQEFLGEAELALAAWTEARELASKRDELPAALDVLRARVRIERLQESLAESPP